MASTNNIPPEIGRVLFDANQIQTRLQEIAKEIDEAYKGQEVVLICVLKGAFMFLADLARHLTVQHTIEFIAVSSYGSSTTTSGNVKLVMDTRQDIAGKNVLIIEDICDTGLTLSYLLQMLSARHPKTIECCVFLQKSKCLKVPEIRLKWVCFQVEPVFVVGYGLDYAERYRTLGFVGELKEEAYKH
jgi:hypoxanthine phosphoribosyltransferase